MDDIVDISIVCMTVLVVEDEELTASELKSILSKIDMRLNVAAVAGTVKAAVEWLKNNQVDLIFMDIHLGDGESFQIFQQVKVNAPVIFTTAYSQYSLKAFKHQGVDYLVKPYDEDDVRAALNKLRLFGSKADFRQHAPPPGELKAKERFIVNIGSRLKTIAVQEVAYFMASDKHLYLVTYDAQRYIIEETITSLEPQLPAKEFFRINRKFIISIRAVKEMYKLSRNRVRIILQPEPEESIQVAVSEDRADAFKQWLNL